MINGPFQILPRIMSHGIVDPVSGTIRPARKVAIADQTPALRVICMVLEEEAERVCAALNRPAGLRADLADAPAVEPRKEPHETTL